MAISAGEVARLQRKLHRTQQWCHRWAYLFLIFLCLAIIGMFVGGAAVFFMLAILTMPLVLITHRHSKRLLRSFMDLRGKQ